METKYRFHWYVYLVVWSIPIIIFLEQMRTRSIYNYAYHDAHNWVFVLSALFIAIISSTGYYAMNNKGLRMYSCFKNKHIAFDKVEFIVLLPPLKGMGMSFRVCIMSKDEKIQISNWTKNYKEILKRVLAEAQKRGIQGIDREVVALLK